MAEESTSAKKNGSQNFRVHTASTKVTQSEFVELERAATERGLRLSEWIREVLFRELRGHDQMNSGSHVNYGYRLLAEVVGMRVFLNYVLSTMSRGEWLDAEQYQEILRQVKAKKHGWAQELLAEEPPNTHG
jgi:hypothetical protein